MALLTHYLVVIVHLIEVLVYVITPRILGEMDHNSRRWLPSLRQTETTVAYLPAGRTHPLLVTYSLDKRLPIAIEEARSAELPTYPSAVLVVAKGLCIDGLLSALMACGPIHTIVDLVRAACQDLDAFGGAVGRLVVKLNGNLRFVNIHTPAANEMGGVCFILHAVL